MLRGVFLTMSDTDSNVTYAARTRKQVPTIRRLRRSLRSRLSASASAPIRQRSAVPEMTSMRLSVPKPTREMLPAIAPAMTATSPSRVFHPIVKYSSRFPRRAICWRIASSIAPRIAPVRQGLQRCDRAIDFRFGFAASRLHIRLHNRVADWPKGAIWGGSGWGIK